MCIKKVAENALTPTTQKSPLGVSLTLTTPTLVSLLGVKFECSDERPRHFYMRVPPAFIH